MRHRVTRVFIILFGMLDLGLAVLDYNTLTEASRRSAGRQSFTGSCPLHK